MLNLNSRPWCHKLLAYCWIQYKESRTFGIKDLKPDSERFKTCIWYMNINNLIYSMKDLYHIIYNVKKFKPLVYTSINYTNLKPLVYRMKEIKPVFCIYMIGIISYCTYFHEICIIPVVLFHFESLSLILLGIKLCLWHLAQNGFFRNQSF